MSDVGIVGIGRIGLPVAQNLIEKGFAVHGFRRSGAVDFTATGGTLCATAADVAAAAPIVIFCLPDEVALQETVDAFVRTGRSGQVVIEMSTFPIEVKRTAHDLLASAGIDMLDCPVLGLPPMVSNRTAVVLASGEASCHGKVTYVLDAITERHVYTGAFGNGSKFKFVANSLVASNTAAAAEALVLASRLDLDLTTVIRTLRGSAADSTMLQAKGPMMVEHRYNPSLGPVGLLSKDVAIITELAADAGLELAVLAASSDLLREAVAQGRADDDTASLFELISAAPTQGRSR